MRSVKATLFDADVTSIDVHSDDTTVIGDFDFDFVPRIGEALLLWVGGQNVAYRVTDICHLGNSPESAKAGFDYPGSYSLHLTVRKFNAPNP